MVPVVQTKASIMRFGRFTLLAGILAALAVTTAVARARRRPSAMFAATAANIADVATVDRPADAHRPALSPPVSPRPAARPAPAVAQARSEDAAAAARIDALVQAGDIGRARDLAEDFLRLYPLSGYCQHIETLTGVHPRPPIPGE
jgi:hypothetical protein